MANQLIRHPEVRIIGAKGENLGVFPIAEALKIAEEHGSDLVEISSKARPPVVRLMEIGKFLYQKSKEEKKKKNKTQELKSIRITLGISPHDQEIKAEKIGGFLDEGNPVEIRLFLKGRERQNKNFARQKFVEFTHLIKVPFKVNMEPKYIGNGFTMQIAKESRANE